MDLLVTVTLLLLGWAAGYLGWAIWRWEREYEAHREWEMWMNVREKARKS